MPNYRAYYPPILTDEIIAELIERGFAPDCGVGGCNTLRHYRDVDGYDVTGYNEDGYDVTGYNEDGYDQYGYDRDGYNEEGYDQYGDRRYDDDDYDDGPDTSALHNYSYTPRLVFRGDRGPFYGMEIEVTTDEITRLVAIVQETAGDLIYCKEDGSVRGAELVTHPMSYAWAMASFPWHVLTELQRDAGASIIPQENGIHIHVGRDAFKDSAHLYRWMKLWYRNPVDIQRIARRTASSWASFDPSARAAQVNHAKYGKPSYNPWNDGTRNSRYQAINTTNEETLEVRVFASTLRPQRAKAALQLVASSVEYTRGISAESVLHRHAWEWRAFMAWVQKAEIYPDLVAENGRRRAAA